MSICPHTEEIGKLQAKVMYLEQELEKLQRISQLLSNSLLEEQSQNKGYWKGVEITTRIIGAILLASLFLALGKVTGAAEVFLSFFKL